jgi:hypothetical protein
LTLASNLHQFSCDPTAAGKATPEGWQLPLACYDFDFSGAAAQAAEPEAVLRKLVGNNLT